MPGSLSHRIRCISKRKSISAKVRPGRWESIWRAAEWYGLHQQLVRRSMRLYDDSLRGYRIVEWRDMSIVTPKSFSLDRLASIIVELSVPTNPHYFFHPAIHPEAASWVLDVGACEGLFSLLSQKRWPHCPSMAVEPGREMCGAMNITFQMTPTAIRPVVENCLLGANDGMAGFIEDIVDPARSRVVTGADPGLDGRHRVVIVKVRTIDGLFASSGRRVGVIKMDAEGAELEILKGSRAILDRDRPALCLTTYHNRDDAIEIASWLEQQGLDYDIQVRGITCMDTLEPRPIMLFAFPR